MAIRFGGAGIKSVMLGTTAIKRVYQGDVVVFEAGSGDPEPPAALPHRYWRISFIQNGPPGSGYLGLSDLLLAATPGGPSIATGGTALGSGDYQAGSAGNAFDGNNASIVQWSNSDFQRWLGYDFGVPVTVNEIGIRPNKDDLSRTPRDFAVEWSDDGLTWTSANWYVKYNSWILGEYSRFGRPAPLGAGARYWRLYAGFIGISELELLATPMGADMTGPGLGTPSARTTYDSTTGAANAFDNNTSTIYSATGSARMQWLQWDFGAGITKKVNAARIRARSSLASQAPAAGHIQYSPDDIIWATGWAYSGPAFGGGENRLVTRPDHPSPMRYTYAADNTAMTLPAPASPGSHLVAVGTSQFAAPAAAAGWTQSSYNGEAATSRLMTIATKRTAQEGDGASFVPLTSSPPSMAAMFNISADYTLAFEAIYVRYDTAPLPPISLPAGKYLGIAAAFTRPSSGTFGHLPDWSVLQTWVGDNRVGAIAVADELDGGPAVEIGLTAGGIEQNSCMVWFFKKP